ncbi:MAG: glycosyltransferase family 4 protein [Nanoarchaeota archaeon]|nr:glycosyltransferase family 4 protein [Nanoarchaeota archaeon]MBU4284506.1 glycosyltransferase family 4 protein [Nanoarchaeota archaeon]MBU4493573.1 glycosyltransferase family 4 protein [Nanoarchaeota archaeon]
MKKLLIATDSFLPRWDGIARFLNEIIPKLSDDYDITVIAPGFKGKLKDFKNINIIRIPLSRIHVGDYTPAKFSIRKIIKAVKQADIVWTQTIGPIGMPAILTARFFRKPLVAYIHSLEWELFSKSISQKNLFRNSISFFTKAAARYLYNKCNILMVPSLEVSEILNWHNIRTKKRVVHLGTDTFKFRPAEDKKAAKKKIGINPKNTVIGFSGRIGREKDIVTLYRAFLRLRKSYDNLILLVIGKGVQELKLMLESKKDIIVVESADNIVPYLQAMDIYVMPSLTETSSLSTMEAMSCGIAVVSTPVGYIKGYIKDGYNGFFFGKQNSYELSKKLSVLLDNKELRIKLGENARKTIIAFYNWDKTTRGIKDALEEFISSG